MQLKSVFADDKKKLFPSENTTILVYFTGYYCGFSKASDKFIFFEKLPKEDILIVSYEVDKSKYNHLMMREFDKKYHIGNMIPNLLAGNTSDKFLAGSDEIILKLGNLINNNKNNKIIFPDEKLEYKIEDLRSGELPLFPKIFYKNKMIGKEKEFKTLAEAENNTKIIKDFFIDNRLPSPLNKISPVPIRFSGGTLTYKNATRINGWLFQWN